MNIDGTRFWAGVDMVEGGCWLWKGRRYKDGYGEFRSRTGKSIAAHRASWMLASGEIPTGMVICHHCDNPPCVNPAHLFVGTQQENERDKHAKGRAPSTAGASNGNARLTAEQVHKLRRMCASVSDTELGGKFGISRTQVRDIRRGRSWSQLPWETARLPPRARGRPKSVRTDGLMRCGKCRAEKPVSDFAPSVAQKGSGWCRACYSAWSKARPKRS